MIEPIIGATPEWMEEAACRHVPPDWMFPSDSFESKRATEVCAGCPVRVTCLKYALDNDEQWGTWGGVSEAGRAEWRKARRNRDVPAETTLPERMESCDKYHPDSPADVSVKREGGYRCRVCRKLYRRQQRSAAA